jgi:hypothetical protein
MTKFNCILLPTNLTPFEMTVKIPSGTDTLEALKVSLNRSSLVSANTDIGVMYYSPEDSEKIPNALASSLRQKHTHGLPTDLSAMYGTVILTGEGDVATSVAKTAFKICRDVYKGLGGTSSSGSSDGKKKKKDKDLPKRAKRSFDYFSSEFQKNRRIELAALGQPAVFTELTKEARVVWDKTDETSRKPYEEKAVADIERYTKEMELYRVTHPLPPKRVRQPYNIYSSSVKGDKDAKSWKDMTSDERTPFVTLSDEDKKRYESELESFRSWCKENGKDADTELSAGLKRKSSPNTGEGGAKKPKKAKNEEAEE